LIGAYMAHASFLDCDIDGIIALNSRFHSEKGDDTELPADIVDSAIKPCRSFIYEKELEWRAHWLGLVNTNIFEAEWWSSSGEAVRAVMTEVDAGFVRRESSDRNDGTYSIESTYPLDLERSVQLIAGIRTLRSGIPRTWRAVWWQQFSGRSIASGPD